MNKQTSTRPLIWIDLIRITGALLVILVHVTYPLVQKWGEVTLKWWLAANLANQIGHLAVPLFFMVSGFLLVRKPEPVRQFLIKRGTRILIPLAAWSVIYIGWNMYFNHRETTLASAALALLTGSSADHLWFLYDLFGLTLAVPLLWKLREAGGNRTLLYLLLLWLIFEPLTQLSTLLGVTPAFTLPLASGYLGYFILGLFLGERQYPRWQVFLALGICLATTGLGAAGNYWQSRAAGSLTAPFLYYIGIVTVPASAGAFVLLKTLGERLERGPAWLAALIHQLGTGSFGVYLIHLIILEAFKQSLFGFKLTATSLHPFYAIPLTTLAVFTVSMTTILILQKIPLLNKIIP